MQFCGIINDTLSELENSLFICDYCDTLKKIHFSILVVVSSDEEGPTEQKSSEILKLQPKQDDAISHESESTSEPVVSELPLITCESVQVIYFCLLTD